MYLCHMKNYEDIRKKLELQKEIDKKNRETLLKKYWENLKPFNQPEDVPELPRAEEKEWKEFYVPKLIDAGAIPKNKLIDGQVYIGNHRNTTIARWNQKTNKFDHMRYKFGWIKDKCNHFEDDDGFALFVPIKLGTEEDWNNRLK